MQRQGVQRAGGSSGSYFQDMGIDHRRAHVRMPQQFLHRADVGARLQQVRGKAVAQDVHGDGFANARLGYGFLQGTPQSPLIEVIAPPGIVNTDGMMRLDVRGRCAPSSHGRSMPSTSR